MKIKIGVWKIVSVCFLCSPFFASAQPYKRLTARDFTGVPPTDKYFAAYTFCYVNYTYSATKHNGAYNVDFDVRLDFNKQKSWIRFDQVDNAETLAGVLKHEQGHYNIAYLMQRELYSVLSHHQYTANYQYEIASLFRVVDTKYHKLNDDYEAQTMHMTDVRNQQKWNAWFSKQLYSAELASNN